MNAASAGVYMDFQGLSALRAGAREDTPEALRAVARQFEALFLQMMLKSMRAASEGDPLFDSDHASTYREMYDQQLSLDLSEKGIGLADVLVRQLQIQQEKELSTAAGMDLSVPAASAPTLAYRQKQVQGGEHAAIAGRVSASEIAVSGEDFVRKLWPLAEQAAARIGVSAETLIAQAALETGWGKAVIRHADGSSSHNLFNIKADGRWQGESVSKSTLEYRQGVANREVARFRSYASFADSFDDYVNFLQNNPRYADALQQTGNPHDFIRALQDAGYATDPAYAQKIGQILDKDIIASVDGLKNTADRTLS